MELLAVHCSDDRVLTIFRLADGECAWIWTVKDGKAVWCRAFLDLVEARAEFERDA